jgi:hypothetical protein
MINNIFKMAIICLILVGAAGCESKSNSSSHPPTQQQDAPIEPPALSENARTAFSAFNKFQASTTFTSSDCVNEDPDDENSCFKNDNSLDGDQTIQIMGIAPNEYTPYQLNHSNDNSYHYYTFYNDLTSLSFDENEEITLELFKSNTIRYLDTDESLPKPLSNLTDKIRNVHYAFIPEKFSINPNTSLPTTPIEMMHGAMIVVKLLYITQTKKEAERLDKGPSHLKIEFHVKNNDGTTSIYSSANIIGAEYSEKNTHHNLTDETGTVVGSFLSTNVYPIDGKPNIYQERLEFYDTNKTLF